MQATADNRTLEALDIILKYINKTEPKFSANRQVTINEALIWLQGRYQSDIAEHADRQDEAKAIAQSLAENLDYELVLNVCKDELMLDMIKELMNKNISPKVIIEATVSTEDLRKEALRVNKLLDIDAVEISENQTLYQTLPSNNGEGAAKGLLIETPRNKNANNPINVISNPLQNSSILQGQNAFSTPFRNSNNQTFSLLQPMRNLSIKDAIDLIPKYDGFNMLLGTFLESCRESLTLIQPENEPVFTRLIKMRLQGEALKSTQGKIFASVDELAKYLDTMFGSSKTCLQLGGELATSKQSEGENAITFANRIRSIAQEVSEAARRENRNTVAFGLQLEKDKVKHFVRGLRWDLRARMGKHTDLEKATAQAVEIERELIGNENLIPPSGAVERKNKETAQIKLVEAKTAEKCNYCQIFGHNEANCWKRINVRPKSNQKNYSHDPNRAEPTRSGDARRYEPNQLPPVQLSGERARPENQFSQTNFRNISPNRNSPVTQNNICNYCKKPGHWKEQCRKKAYNDRKRNQLQENGRSFATQDAGAETQRNQRPNSPRPQ